MRPICVTCRVEMRCAKNSFVVRDPDAGGFPSTYWSGDRYECEGCGASVVIGRGGEVTAEDAQRYGWTSQALEFDYSLMQREARLAMPRGGR